MDPEARSRLLIEHMAEALAVCELVRDETGRPVDCRLEEVNPAFERLVGVARADALGRLRSEVLDPADDAWLEHYPRVVESGQPDRFEHDSASTGRWFDVRVFPMAGDRFIVLFNDITAQKQSDERLRRAADRHGFLLRLADALRSLADPEEVQATASRLLAQHLGVDRVALVETHADQGDGHPETDHGVPCVPGVPGVPGTPARAWTNEEIELIREVADRTWSAVARARAEAALRASEEEHRTLFAAMDQGVHICELLRDEAGRAVDFRFLSVNPAHERQTGIPAGRLVGRTLFELTPGIGEAWLDAAASAVETGQTVKAQDYSAPLGRWFDVAFVPRGGDRFAAFFENTTARKTLEVDLARLLDQEHRARMEAESATRLRDEFLAIVSHELRTPLAAILLWSRLLASGRIPGREREAMAIIERNAEAQRLLIEDLLDASRMIAGQVTLEALPRDLVPLVAEAVEAMRPAAVEREVGLELTVGADAPAPGADPGGPGDPAETPAGPPIAAVDDQRLAQVLRNLIDNALRYSERGGTVRIRVAREGDRALVEVRDTGRGIEPALLPHVFDRFRRGDDSGESHEGGLGLGLSIAHELVQLHGGTIEAASGGRGAGATFTVRLPVVEATTAADEPRRTGSPGGRPGHRRVIDGPGAATARAPRLRGQRILVVEDDPDTLAALRVVLESEGAAVTVAATGADALARLAGAEARFEAMVSDLALPGEDGLALVGRVRAAEATGAEGAVGARTRLRTVALSAIATEEQRQRALRAGFDAWLARPVDETELLAALRPTNRPGRGSRPG